MTDHAVIVPTVGGPVGAIVSVPEQAPRAALIVLQGGGRPGRSGINGVWTRLARRLAGLGLLVLRFDYAGEGDGTMLPKRAAGLHPNDGIDPLLLADVAAWLRERSGIPELHLIGDCYGGRLAIQLAATDPHVVGAYLNVPYLRSHFVELEVRRRRLDDAGRGDGALDRNGFDAQILEALPGMLERGPVWILAGEEDGDEAIQVKRLLGERGRGLEIELVPGMAVHPVGAAVVQEEVTRRLLVRISRALDAMPVLSPAASHRRRAARPPRCAG